MMPRPRRRINWDSSEQGLDHQATLLNLTTRDTPGLPVPTIS